MLMHRYNKATSLSNSLLFSVFKYGSGSYADAVSGLHKCMEFRISRVEFPECLDGDM